MCETCCVVAVQDRPGSHTVKFTWTVGGLAKLQAHFPLLSPIAMRDVETKNLVESVAWQLSDLPLIFLCPQQPALFVIRLTMTHQPTLLFEQTGDCVSRAIQAGAGRQDWRLSFYPRGFADSSYASVFLTHVSIPSLLPCLTTPQTTVAHSAPSFCFAHPRMRLGS